MATIVHCSECGEALPAYWPKGLCPRCALDGALAETAHPGGLPAGTGAPGHPTGAARFGDYELLEEIARGGMGVIYRARQIRLNRVVALKMILAGQFASKQEILRFRSEAEAAAHLQHPHIVRIHETGECDGRHYFSMDFVDGRTLADIVRDGPLPANRAARYVRQIAEAIHFAHTRGVLHRDLKPSNIVIDAQDEPRITDFGLAKRMRNDFGVTVTGQVLGSPNFMPPEQTSAKSEKVGPAADVYGVGAILYCLLAGRPPFHAETIEELLLLLRDTEPVSPRLLNPSVPRDLETVCLKCLEKDPARRYPTAQALAEELGRFLQDEPIVARPLSFTGRFWRWCRRRPAVAALSASVIFLLVAVAATSSLAALRVNRAGNSEQRANRDLRRTVSLLELERAETFFNAHDAGAGVAHLSAILRRDPTNSIAAHRLMSAVLQRGWGMRAKPPMRHGSEVMTASFSPDGRQVVTASRDKTAKVWDAATGRPLLSLNHAGPVFSANYSPDGRRILTASAGGLAQLFDADTGTVQSQLRHSNQVHWAEFSRDGTLAVTACADHVARIWDVLTGTLKKELRGHSHPILVARFSPDGALVATGTDRNGIRIWNADTGKMIHKLEGHRDSTAVLTLAFSPDGRRLVTGGYDNTARLWNLATGEPIGAPLLHKLRVWCAEFSPDGNTLVTASEGGTARLWDVQTMRPIGESLRHESGVIFARFSPDGRSVATCSSDNTARLWDVLSQKPLCQPMRQIGRVSHSSFSADGRRLVTGSDDKVAQVWDLRGPLEPSVQIQHDRNVVSIVVTPDGGAVLTAGADQTLRLWNLHTGRPLSELAHYRAYVSKGTVSPDGRRIAVAFYDQALVVWNLEDWKSQRNSGNTPDAVAIMKHEKRIRSVRFSPDGSQLVTVSADRTTRVWNATNGQLRTAALVHGAEINSANFSPDNCRVVTASEDYTAQVWDAHTGARLVGPLTHLDHVKWAEFSPDGRKVVTASTDNTAALWDARTGQRLLTLQHTRIVQHAAFSPDGRRVVTACIDRTAQIWDSETGQVMAPPLRHELPVTKGRYSTDGRRIMTTTWSDTSAPGRLWDAETGRPLTEWVNLEGSFGLTSWDPAGTRVIMGATNGVASVWHLPVTPMPVPEWFLQFAEALAGIRLGDRGTVESVSPDPLGHLAQSLPPGGADSLYADLVRRLLANP